MTYSEAKPEVPVNTPVNPDSAEATRPVPDEKSATFLARLRHQSKTDMRWVMGAALASTLGMIAFSAAVALTVGGLIANHTPDPWLWLLGIAGILIRLLANMWRDRIGQLASAKQRSALRQNLLGQMTMGGPNALSRRGNVAWWTHHYLDQVDALHGYLARYLPARYAVLVTPAVIIAVVLWIDWLAGLLLLLATPTIPIFMVLIGWGTESVHRAQQEEQASLAGHLLDRLQALAWLRRLGALEEVKHGVQEAAEDYRRVAMRVLRVAFLSSAALEFFSALSIGLLAIYIGFSLLGFITWGPAAGVHLTSGLFMLMLAPECFLPLRQLAQAHHDMTAAKASAQVLTDGFGNLVPMPDHNPQIMKDKDPDIATRALNVTFFWPDRDEPVLKDITLTVSRSEVIGISGHSGQGKSTLLGVLAGFIKPSSGIVTRDSHWAWINQRPHLFHGSLRENLLLACASPVTDDALLEALTHAGITLPDAMLPQGLDTALGQSNPGVSGGQAQRIALCRAVLSKSTLWLLDEPTAALDDTTRDALLKTLFSYVKAHQISVITSSHDPVVLGHCNRVLRIQDGQLLEQAK
jgi:ATP-binding cassette subfamily C protein CydD